MSGRVSVPVVMTGACGAEQGRQLEEAWLDHHGAGWIKFEPLDRFRSDDDNPEDILAYQWWLLNPPQGRSQVYAPRRGSSLSWHGLLRYVMQDKALYDEQVLFTFVKKLVPDYFTANRARGQDDARIGLLGTLKITFKLSISQWVSKKGGTPLDKIGLGRQPRDQAREVLATEGVERNGSF